MASTLDDNYIPPTPGMKGYTPDVDGSPNWLSTLYKGAGHLLDGGSSLTDLLDYLRYAREHGNLSSDGKDALNDFSKQLVDQMIANQLRDEQRQYDNPLAQVQRLMAAGMSRDAALQALNGGQQPIAGVDGLASTESASNAASARESNSAAISNFASTAMGSLTTALSAAQFGLSVPSMLNQNAITGVSSYLAQKQQSAFDGLDSFSRVVESEKHGGVLDISQPGNAEHLNSVDSMISALRASKNPDTVAYMSGDYLTAASNPFFMQNLDAAFNSRWSTAGMKMTPEQIEEQRRQFYNLGRIQDQTIEKFQAENAKTAQETKNLLQQFDFNEIMQPLLAERAEKELRQLDDRHELDQQEKAVNRSRVAQADLDTDWINNNYDQISDLKCQELSHQLFEIGLENNPDIRKLRKQNLRKDLQAQLLLTQLSCLELRATSDYWNANPEKAKLLTAAKSLGLTPNMEGVVSKNANDLFFGEPGMIKLQNQMNMRLH